MFVLIALPLARDLRTQIKSLQTHPEYQKYLRPSRMELHITLKAPQIIDDSAKEDWIKNASQACTGFAHLEMDIGDMYFITSNVLALDLDRDPLLALHNKISRSLQKYNQPGDTVHEGGRFNPHITIGRAKTPLGAAQRKQILENLTPLTLSERLQVKLVRLYGREENAYRPILDIGLS